MTAYTLRLIAIITMVFDHSSYLFYGAHLSWMNFIGRIAFPIFAFQISEGYIHTHSFKKYFMRLLIFALISQIPYAFFKYSFSLDMNLNIIFTLILGLMCIAIYDLLHYKAKEKCVKKNEQFSYNLLGLIIVLCISVFADLFNFDYGFYGVFIIFLFYLYHNNKILMNTFVSILTFIYYMPYFMASNFSLIYVGLFFCSLIPLIFINLYNGQKGKNQKLLFYIFYPLHLLILCIIYKLMNM